MSGIETDHNTGQQELQGPLIQSQIDAEIAALEASAREAELIATVDRWSTEATAAEHKAIYGSMARDIAAGLEQQARKAAK